MLLLQNPPWAQSASYSAALRESRNPTALQLTGRGDPTARGRGFSYMREEIKKAKEEAAAVKAKDDGTVQGEVQACRMHARCGWARLVCERRAVFAVMLVRVHNPRMVSGIKGLHAPRNLSHIATSRLLLLLSVDMCRWFCVCPMSGTDADLRRLGHKHAGELLMTKFNMSAEEVNALPRWDRIDVIRRWVTLTA